MASGHAAGRLVARKLLLLVAGVTGGSMVHGSGSWLLLSGTPMRGVLAGCWAVRVQDVHTGPYIL